MKKNNQRMTRKCEIARTTTISGVTRLGFSGISGTHFPAIFRCRIGTVPDASLAPMPTRHTARAPSGPRVPLAVHCLKIVLKTGQ